MARLEKAGAERKSSFCYHVGMRAIQVLTNLGQAMPDRFGLVAQQLKNV